MSMESVLGLGAASRVAIPSPHAVRNAFRAARLIGNVSGSGNVSLRYFCRKAGLSNSCPRSRKNNPLVCRAGLEEIAPVTAAVYGLTLLSGGLVAYSRTGSKGSLAGGVTGGVAFAVAYLLMLNPETKDLANAIGFGAAFLFVAVFGIRLAATRKPLPSGLLLVVSIAASVVFVNAYLNARLI